MKFGTPMISRVASWAAIIAALSIVLLIGTVVQWAELDARLFLFIAYAAVAIIVAVTAARGLPAWWTVALVGALLVAAGLLLWPRDPGSWNYLFEPLLLSGVAAAAVALIVYRVRARSVPDESGDLPSTASLLRPAGLWASALALGAFGLLLLFSFNPVGLGFVVSGVALVIATGVTLLRGRRRLLALLCAGLVTPIPLITLQLVLVATGAVAPDQRYEIPASYGGWVIVQEETPECPALVTDQGTFVYAIDAHGCGCTSSKPPQGWSRVTYLAVAADRRTALPTTGWGGGGLIWAGFSGYASNRPHPFSGFFVGTEEELNRSWSDQHAQEARCLVAR
jgi:hypothetical protein